jgi:hypothetical protein
MSKFKTGDIVLMGPLSHKRELLAIVGKSANAKWHEEVESVLVCRVEDRLDLKKEAQEFAPVRTLNLKVGEKVEWDLYQGKDWQEFEVIDVDAGGVVMQGTTYGKGYFRREMFRRLGTFKSNEETPEYMTRAEMQKLAAQEARKVLEEDLWLYVSDDGELDIGLSTNGNSDTIKRICGVSTQPIVRNGLKKL